MRRLACTTAVIAAACLGSVPASASGGGASPDPDVPLLESNGGMAPVYVDVDNPEKHQLDVSWTHEFGTQLAVPRTSTTVSIALPPVVRELHAERFSVRVMARAGTDEVYLDTFFFPVLPEPVITLQLPDLLAIGARIVPHPEELELSILAYGTPDVFWLNADADLVLTDDPAVGPAELELELPAAPATAELDGYRTGVVAIAEGTRVRVEAVPGFWDADHGAVLTATLYGVDDEPDVPDQTEVVGLEVSDDGSTVVVPALPRIAMRYPFLEVVERRDGVATRYVAMPLVLASMDAVEEYVIAVYNDLFGRDPDPTGLTGWADALMRGVPYSAVSDAITASDEFRMGLISDAYARYLGRLPDDEGLLGWLRAMNRGLHIQQMEAGFLASQEYFDVWGEGTNAGWIQSLYLDVLGREASPTEVQAWLPSIARDGREQVARGFLYSTEKLETDVDGYYQWLLRRPLDDTGRTGWVRAIQGGHRVEEIIAGIIASQEYRGNVPVG